MNFTYTVTGTGPFPIDMLRHDRCTPHKETDSGLIEASHRPREHREREITVVGRTPTRGRWSSFGWTVGNVVEVA